MSTARSGHEPGTGQPGVVSRPLPEERLAVTHGEMDAAFDRGAAVPLARSVPWLMRYRDAWWVVFEHGWVRVHDDLVEHDLDRFATRMTAAEEAADATRDVPDSGDG